MFRIVPISQIFASASFFIIYFSDGYSLLFVNDINGK